MVKYFKNALKFNFIAANTVASHRLGKFFVRQLSRMIFVHDFERATNSNQAFGTSRSQLANDLLCSLVWRGLMNFLSRHAFE